MVPSRKIAVLTASAAIAVLQLAACDEEAPERGDSAGGTPTQVSEGREPEADGECGQGPLESAQAEQPTPPIGIFWRQFEKVSPPDRFPQQPDGEVVAEFDPQTLAISQRERILLKSRITAAWAYSPNQRYLALGDVGTSGVRIVDLENWEISSRLELPGDGSVKHLTWVRSGRLLAMTDGKETQELVAVDPNSGRVFARQELALSHRTIAVDPFRGRLVILQTPVDAIGRARLALFSGSGRLIASDLARIQAGARPELVEGKGRDEQPALAVDPATGRAFVLPADGPVAEVDISSDALTVTYHDVAGSGLGATRFRNHLRTATWLGCETIALTGTDSRPIRPRHRFVQHPAGLQLIDTRSWTTMAIDSRTEHVSVSDGLLLASKVQPPDSFRSAGLTILSTTGAELGRIPRRREPRLLGATAGYAYVSIGSRPKTKIGVFELPSAAKIGTTRPSAQSLQFPSGSARLSEAARTRGYYP